MNQEGNGHAEGVSSLLTGWGNAELLRAGSSLAVRTLGLVMAGLILHGCGDADRADDSDAGSSSGGATGAGGRASSSGGAGGEGSSNGGAGTGGTWSAGGGVSEDGGPPGGGTGAGGASPSGCALPPPSTFDPLTGFRSPSPPVTRTVMNADDSGAGSLRDAVASANEGDVIGFHSSLAGATVRFESAIDLSRGLTIDGSGAPGITLDGQSRTRILQFNGDAPTRIALFSLRLMNGRTDASGAALSVNGGALDLEIAGCAFEGNTSSEGGAVRAGYAHQTKVLIRDSTFLRNDGTVPGGGNGFSGGAVSATGGNLHVLRCRFEQNVGPTTGAVYTIHSNPLVEDSVFIANRSSGDAGSGAFFADGGGPGDYGTDYSDPANQIPGRIALVRTLFESNRGAGDDGGAVEAYAYPLDVVTFDACMFKDNVADPGRAGAAFIHADNAVRITRTVFAGNRATSPGGAIWADGDGSYLIENTLFSGNSTDSDLGGALRLNISEAAALRVVSSTFVENSATDGNGALWLPGMRDVWIQNSLFVDNRGEPWSQQINFRVESNGGNIIWPDPRTDAPTLDARVVDPQLGTLEALDGTLVRAPTTGSPAVDGAVGGGPAVDQRGAPRSGAPDVGSLEVGATCTP